MVDIIVHRVRCVGSQSDPNRNSDSNHDRQGTENIDNAFSLSQAGVDVINVGGAIANAADPSAVYRAMQQEVSRKGTI